MQHNQTTRAPARPRELPRDHARSEGAWLPFFIIALVTMVILFIIADVRLP